MTQEPLKRENVPTLQVSEEVMRMVWASPLMCQGCIDKGQHTWPCPRLGEPVEVPS